MQKCMLCPRMCGANRTTSKGACGAPYFPYIARAALHMWEEPCISGVRGSGAVFFCGCNLKCVFCQNYDISNGTVGKQYDASGIADVMLALEKEGAHNINFVSPAPFVPLLAQAITAAKERGLSVPIVYNTNAYERVETLKMLDGLVDIYLPDLKYVDSRISRKYSGAEDYFAFAAQAIAEMYRQTGSLKTDEAGIAVSGLIVRHLVLPGSVDETRRVLDYLSENYPRDTAISLMGQYVPFYKAKDMPPLNRKLLQREYDRAVDYCLSLGFENVMIQELEAAKSEYTPVFDGSVAGK